MNPGPDTQSESQAQKVFICYRREETAAHAGRLYDAMVARFGESNVFMDVDIAPGVDFVERITQVVSGCLVLIVVMGQRWATAEDEDGNARLADPDDFVRLEVETALRRPDVTPIPVLVSGARMPKRETLPEPLQPLTRRNALDLSDARWAYDVGRLNSTLDVLLDEVPEDRETGTEPYPTPMPISPDTPAPTPVAMPDPTPLVADQQTSAPPSSETLNWRLVLEGMAVAGVTAVAGRLLMGGVDFDQEGDGYRIAEVLLRRGVTWALVGLVLAVWLATRMRRANRARFGLTGLLVGALAGVIGGAIWTARVYLPGENLGIDSSEANMIQILALAVTCGLLGALVGQLWRPARPGVGLAVGAASAAILQLIVNTLGLNTADQPGNAFLFGLAAIAFTGVVLTTFLILDRQEEVTVGVRAAEP